MAMVEWAAQQGHAALNLQHDGVVICLFVGDVSQSSVATSITYMTAACNLWKDANLGHEQYDAIANPALRGDPVARRRIGR